MAPCFFRVDRLRERKVVVGWERCQNGRLTASPIVPKNCKLALAGLQTVQFLGTLY